MELPCALVLWHHLGIISCPMKKIRFICLLEFTIPIAEGCVTKSKVTCTHVTGEERLPCRWKEQQLEAGGSFRNGSGLLRIKNVDLYSGQFFNYRYNGAGVYKYANGDVYRGEFKEHLMHGSGVYRFKNGAQYEGKSRHDLPFGNGVFTFSNGVKRSENFDGMIISSIQGHMNKVMYSSTGNGKKPETITN